MSTTLSQLSDYARYRLMAKNAHGIHSPFVFNLYTNIIAATEDYYDFGKLAKIRKKLEACNDVITIGDFGAGSRIFSSNQRKIADICRHGISSEKYAQLLFRLVNYFAPKTIVELGTSLGLTTMYLAAPNSKSKVYTLEGSESLVEFARKQFGEHDYNNIEVIKGNFDEQLHILVDRLDKIDFVYIDGNHAKQPTLNYFELILKKCKAISTPRYVRRRCSRR